MSLSLDLFNLIIEKIDENIQKLDGNMDLSPAEQSRDPTSTNAW